MKIDESSRRQEVSLRRISENRFSILISTVFLIYITVLFLPAVLMAEAGMNEPFQLDGVNSDKTEESDVSVLGDQAAEKGDWTLAARYYREAVEKEPDSYEFSFRLARALSFSDSKEEALQIYNRLIEKYPGNSDLLLARGRLYSWLGRYGESEKDLLSVTGMFPDYADAWLALGDLYLWSGKYQEAILAYERLIELKPDRPDGYLGRGKVAHLMGDIKKARKDFESARERGLPAKEYEKLAGNLEKITFGQPSRFSEKQSWMASITDTRTYFTPDRSSWAERNMSFSHKRSYGSFAFEVLNAERFNMTDIALAVDSYVKLMARTTINYRYQFSDRHRLYPETSWRGEIFQGVGGGWELSLSRDELNYTVPAVMNGAGLGRYKGNWYYRFRTLIIPVNPDRSVLNEMLFRFYFSGDSDNYVGFSITGGHGDYLASWGKEVSSRSRGATLSCQRFYHPERGFKFSLGYRDSGSGSVEHTLSFSMLTRW